MFNKRMFKKINDKKILHKVGKRWVVVSAVLLGLLGGGTVVTHGVSHAASVTPVQDTNVNKATQMPVANQTSEAASQTMKIGAMNSQAASSAHMLGESSPSNSFSESYSYAFSNAKKQINNDYNYVNSLADSPTMQSAWEAHVPFNYDKSQITSIDSIANATPESGTLLSYAYFANSAASDATDMMSFAASLDNRDNSDRAAVNEDYKYVSSMDTAPALQANSSYQYAVDHAKAVIGSDSAAMSADGTHFTSMDLLEAQQAQSTAAEVSGIVAVAASYGKAQSYMHNSSANSAEESSLAAGQSNHPDVYYSFIPPSNASSSAGSSQSASYVNSSAVLSSMYHRYHANRARKYGSKYLSNASFRGLSRSRRSVTTLKGLKAYRRTRRGRYIRARYIKPNTRLAVRRVLRRGRTVQLELTNGLLITANKRFVTVTKFTKRHARRTIRRHARVSRYTRALRRSNWVLRRGRRRARRYAYREAQRFNRANNAEKRAYRRFSRRHTYRNRRALRQAKVNLNALVNALLK